MLLQHHHGPRQPVARSLLALPALSRHWVCGGPHRCLQSSRRGRASRRFRRPTFRSRCPFYPRPCAERQHPMVRQLSRTQRQPAAASDGTAATAAGALAAADGTTGAPRDQPATSDAWAAGEAPSPPAVQLCRAPGPSSAQTAAYPAHEMM